MKCLGKILMSILIFGGWVFFSKRLCCWNLVIILFWGWLMIVDLILNWFLMIFLKSLLGKF